MRSIKKLQHDDICNIIGISILILSIILFIAGCIFIIWVYVNYGNRPIDEIPVWALSFMW